MNIAIPLPKHIEIIRDIVKHYINIDNNEVLKMDAADIAWEICLELKSEGYSIERY